MYRQGDVLVIPAQTTEHGKAIPRDRGRLRAGGNDVTTRRRWIAGALIALALSWSPFGPDAYAGKADTPDPVNDAAIEASAKKNGADPELAKRIAHCEHNGGSNPFQVTGGKGGNTYEGNLDWSTKELAKGNTRPWAPYSGSCWGGGGGRATGRSAPPPPPTGTTDCNRASGEWRCYPSFSLPDALTVSPTIEADPGPNVVGCSWRAIETGTPVWRCDLLKAAGTGRLIEGVMR